MDRRRAGSSRRRRWSPPRPRPAYGKSRNILENLRQDGFSETSDSEEEMETKTKTETWPEIYTRIKAERPLQGLIRRGTEFHGELMEAKHLIRDLKSAHKIKEKNFVQQLHHSMARMSTAHATITRTDPEAAELNYVLTAYRLASAYTKYKQRSKATFCDKFKIPPRGYATEWDYAKMLKIASTTKGLSIHQTWERLYLFATKERLTYQALTQLIPYFYHDEEVSEAIQDCAKEHKTAKGFVRALAEYASTNILATARMALKASKRQAGEPLVPAFKRAQRHIKTVTQDMPATSRSYHRIERESKALLELVNPKLKEKIKYKLKAYQNSGGDMDIGEMARYAQELEDCLDYEEPTDRPIDVQVQAMDFQPQRFRTVFEKEEPQTPAAASPEMNGRTTPSPQSGHQQKLHRPQEQNGYETGGGPSHHKPEGGPRQQGGESDRERGRSRYREQNGYRTPSREHNAQGAGSQRKWGGASRTPSGERLQRQGGAPDRGGRRGYTPTRDGPRRERSASRGKSANYTGPFGDFVDGPWHYLTNYEDDSVTRMRVTTQRAERSPNRGNNWGHYYPVQQQKRYHPQGQHPHPDMNRWSPQRAGYQGQWPQQQPPGMPPPQEHLMPHHQVLPQQWQPQASPDHQHQLQYQQQAAMQPQMVPQPSAPALQQSHMQGPPQPSPTPGRSPGGTSDKMRSPSVERLLKEFGHILKGSKRPESLRSQSPVPEKGSYKKGMKSVDTDGTTSASAADRKSRRADRSKSPYSKERSLSAASSTTKS